MKLSTHSPLRVKIGVCPSDLIRHNVKLFRTANCFFVIVLFSAEALALAQEQAGPANAPSRQRSGDQPNMQTKDFGLVIHGGAGTIEHSKMTPEREHEYRSGIERALAVGYEILKRGGPSLDATQAAVRVLEDDSHFNAGRGAVFTSIGTNELDAAIMDGKTLKAGAVACLKHIKNPVSLARLVMEKSGHVMMDGEGAEAFAKENGVEFVDQKYFYTEERWQALQKIKAAEKDRGGAGGKAFVISDQDRHGTVGAVALDQNGNLAAATSTGGTTNKRAGRVGDSPVIGAGTYANNATCAVSATGDGEYFIRATVGHDISALMEYHGMSLKEAAQTVLDKVAKLGGTGGLIAIDRQGNVALPFNTSGMYRGYVDPNGKFVVEIYK
jgi:beta-aspartyl-peptidase (threonine type)